MAFNKARKQTWVVLVSVLPCTCGSVHLCNFEGRCSATWSKFGPQFEQKELCVQFAERIESTGLYAAVRVNALNYNRKRYRDLVDWLWVLALKQTTMWDFVLWWALQKCVGMCAHAFACNTLFKVVKPNGGHVWQQTGVNTPDGTPSLGFSRKNSM